MARSAAIRRNTKETQITLRINLDVRGKSEILTGIPFFDHMLDLVTRHGRFDLNSEATGDLDAEQHQTVEDAGIALGEAVASALGNRRGIKQARYLLIPMVETLGMAAIELGGRPHCAEKARFSAARTCGCRRFRAAEESRSA
jgi:imidazoleglycerol-phosphate dehydratase